jgi:deoxyhypusine synthase
VYIVRTPRRPYSEYCTHILKNTGQEFDGSDSGARPDEAVSWGKIRAGAETVKVRGLPLCFPQHLNCHQVFADATLVFPLLVAATFAQKPSGDRLHNDQELQPSSA